MENALSIDPPTNCGLYGMSGTNAKEHAEATKKTKKSTHPPQ
jgi:hypothetical protein